MTQDCLAELSGVHKRFQSTVALNGLDLQVRPGELLSVLGPNGAGKTTAISLMLGLEKPDKGTVSLFGKSPHLLEQRRNIGVMMQEVFLAPELKVKEHIDLVASYYPNPMSVGEALESTHTASLADRRYGVLSGGQKRQAQFAIAVCGRPKLLFLDEPTVGLDIQAREAMWALLRHLVYNGSSIVLTTHYLEEAEMLADRVTVIAQGRVVASGTVNEIKGLVVRKTIGCVTRVPAIEIERWPDVERVSEDQNGLHITVTNAVSVVRRLLADDPEMQELEVRRAGLAEAFAEMSQGNTPHEEAIQ